LEINYFTFFFVFKDKYPQNQIFHQGNSLYRAIHQKLKSKQIINRYDNNYFLKLFYKSKNILLNHFQFTTLTDVLRLAFETLLQNQNIFY